MMRKTFWTVTFAVIAGLAMTVPAVRPAVAACQSADGMIENFMSLYPTGGPAAGDSAAGAAAPASPAV